MRYETKGPKRGDVKYEVEYAYSPIECRGGITVHKEFYKQKYEWALNSHEFSTMAWCRGYSGSLEQMRYPMTEEEQWDHMEQLKKEKEERKIKREKFWNKFKFWR